MPSEITVKVCGLTREQDVDQAIELKADLFGFILYAPSPRGQSLQRAVELAQRVPQGRRVAVDVSPTPERLFEYKAAGFDFFQIHTEAEVSEAQLREWAAVVGSSQLWLSPRLKP
ncbi:MAG: phosphoribosylanthranilate isomerase, partial [Opitutales bacterium]|nr:phosphoribosylanthranilate isomerase [Opitutales bacterium]